MGSSSIELLSGRRMLVSGSPVTVLQLLAGWGPGAGVGCGRRKSLSNAGEVTLAGLPLPRASPGTLNRMKVLWGSVAVPAGFHGP